MKSMEKLLISTRRWIIITGSLILGFLISADSLFAQKVMLLDQALETAWLNSPDIRRAELNLEISRELLNAQNAALKSKFDLALTPFLYSHGRRFDDFNSTWYTTQRKQSMAMLNITQPIKLTDGTIQLSNRFQWQDYSNELSVNNNITFSNSLTIRLDQPIFTYNRTKLNLSELELDLENATLNYALQKLLIESRVTQNFYQLYESQLGMQIAKEEMENTQGNYDIIKNKVAAGLSAQEELYQAELNLATSKSAYYNQQVLVENAKDAFKLLLGISLFEEIDIIADISVDPIPIDIEDALQYGLSQRLELRQREIGINNAQFELIRTSAYNEFFGNISATIGLIGDNEQLSEIYNPATDNEEFSLQLTIPLWDWGERKSRIKAAEAQIQTEELSLSDERNDIIINIRTVQRNLKNLLNQIEIADQSRDNAQLTYEINLERYKNGDLTGMDLNLFQTQLSQKKIDYTTALIDYKLELLNMKIQTLWDFENNASYFPNDIVDISKFSELNTQQ